MADTIFLKDGATIVAQAQTHENLSAYVYGRMAMHQGHYAAFFDTAETSSMPDMGVSYTDWWSTFGSHFRRHAGTHQGVAERMDAIVNTFYAYDGSIST
jgi:hypothetical protein